MSDILQKLFGGINDLAKRIAALELSGAQLAKRHDELPPGCSAVSKTDDTHLDRDDRRGTFIKGLMNDDAVMDSLVKQARHASEQR
jgi:hypothetical protein